MSVWRVLRPMFFLYQKSQTQVVVGMWAWTPTNSCFMKTVLNRDWQQQDLGITGSFMWLQVPLRLHLLPVSAPWNGACGAHPRPSSVALALSQPSGQSLASHHPRNAGRKWGSPDSKYSRLREAAGGDAFFRWNVSGLGGEASCGMRGSKKVACETVARLGVVVASGHTESQPYFSV